MNYDEAIDLIKKIDLEATEIIATDEEINFICNTLETAKKEHELLGLYRKHYELSRNPRKNENPNEIRPYIEWANDINKLEGFIIELEVELTELERELK